MKSVSLPGLKLLSDMVREYRQGSGWTQLEVANRAGISVGALRDLEQGRIARPRGATLRRLAAALELSTSETSEMVRLGQRGPILASGFCLHVLGPVAMVVNDVQVKVESARQRTLLGMLALTPGVRVDRATLVDMMWGTEPPATAEELLQTYMSRMRQRLQQLRAPVRCSEVFVAAGGGYRLDVAADQLDLLAFRDLVASARRHTRDGNLESAFALYRQAIGLWRGDPLLDLPGMQVLPAVAALVVERRTAVQEYADIADRLCRHEEVLPLLHTFADEDPLNEGAHARLMIALANCGQQAAALRAFGAMCARLADELGVDPGIQLRRAHQAILSGHLRQAA